MQIFYLDVRLYSLHTDVCMDIIYSPTDKPPYPSKKNPSIFLSLATAIITYHRQTADPYLPIGSAIKCKAPVDSQGSLNFTKPTTTTYLPIMIISFFYICTSYPTLIFILPVYPSQQRFNTCIYFCLLHIFTLHFYPSYSLRFAYLFIYK